MLQVLVNWVSFFGIMTRQDDGLRGQGLASRHAETAEPVYYSKPKRGLDKDDRTGTRSGSCSFFPRSVSLFSHFYILDYRLLNVLSPLGRP